MPTVEELLNMQDQVSILADMGNAAESGIYCVIDPEIRTIDIPEEYSLLGVVSDEKVERVWFRCPKVVGDNIDLSKLQIRVNYQNANNETDQYIVTDVQTEVDNIVFSWLLSRKVTAYQGTVSFIVCAVKVSGETIQNEWNTTLATSQVLQGLEVDDPEITEEESDVIAQLLQIMTDTSEQAVADVGTAKTSAISAITSQQQTSVSAVQSAQSTAVSEVENAGELIKESLPSDYTELSNKVDELDRTKAPAITESTSGESIQLSDSGDAPLMDIKLYGKSKQDGEPSPDNPVEIEIPGSDGNVEITASDGDEQIKNVTLPTPNGLPGIPVTSGGNYTDADGQQWVCDEIDFKRGKYVQRIVKAVYDGSDDEDWKLNVQSGNWNRYYIGLRTSVLDSNSNNIHSMNTNFQIGAKGSTVNTKNVYNTLNSGLWLSMNGTETLEEFKSYLSLKPMTLYFILATPIETDLTTEQLTAIKQLRTYQTVTNITTDSEPQIGMEVEYTADTKTWIENKLTEIQTQILNMQA